VVKHNIPIENISKLVVASVGGSLYLTGWNQEEIRIKDLSDQDQIKTKKDRIEIHISGDGFIHIPHHLEVEIQSVSGQAVIKRINNEMKVASVGDDLTITDVSTVAAESIGGDLIAKRVQGDLKVENTGGDALIDIIKGQISLRNVGGDIVITDVGGGIEASAGGEGTVDFNPVPWQAYQIKVGGDLSVSVPEECNADLSIKSGAKDISVVLGELDLKPQEAELTQQLGEGGPTVILSAGGKVFLSEMILTYSQA